MNLILDSWATAARNMNKAIQWEGEYVCFLSGGGGHQNQKKQSLWRKSWGQTFLWILWFFCFPEVFLVFCNPSSGWKLPNPKTKKKWSNMKNWSTKKNQRLWRKKILGPDIPENPLAFLFSWSSCCFLRCFCFFSIPVADESFRIQK